MNKASGGYGIPAELFQILKDDGVKVLHSILNMPANLASTHTKPIYHSLSCRVPTQRKTVMHNPYFHAWDTLSRSKCPLTLASLAHTVWGQLVSVGWLLHLRDIDHAWAQ